MVSGVRLCSRCDDEALGGPADAAVHIGQGSVRDADSVGDRGPRTEADPFTARVAVQVHGVVGVDESVVCASRRRH